MKKIHGLSIRPDKYAVIDGDEVVGHLVVNRTVKGYCQDYTVEVGGKTVTQTSTMKGAVSLLRHHLGLD